MSDDDSDETEGRKLYRARADTLARAQVAMGKRRVNLKGNSQIIEELRAEKAALVKALEEIVRIYTHETGRERMSAANKIAIEALRSLNGSPR